MLASVGGPEVIVTMLLPFVSWYFGATYAAIWCGRSQPNSTSHVGCQPPSEMRKLFADLPEACDNTLDIARRCAFLVKKRDPILPSFPTGDGRNEAEELRHQASEGLKRRLDGLALSAPEEEYWTRLDFELGIIEKMGFDPVWWGVVNVVVVELGMIIPPIGIIVFVLHGLAPHIPIRDIYRGVAPFIAADLVLLAILVVFPGLAMWLPMLMKG